MNTDKGTFMVYKGKPLVRCKHTLYYGDMHDPYVTKLDIKSKKNVDGAEVSEKVKEQFGVTLEPEVKMLGM